MNSFKLILSDYYPGRTDQIAIVWMAVWATLTDYEKEIIENGNTTGLGMKFQNKSDNLYNITIDRDKGTKEPMVTYTRNGDVLDVNITLDEGNANINMFSFPIEMFI
jgi:hypothetical protein